MKTTKTINAIIALALFAVFAATPFAAQASDEAQDACGDSEEGCCDVTRTGNPDADDNSDWQGSLSARIDAFNFPGADRARECDQSIYFIADDIQINEPYVLDRMDSDGVTIGNGGRQTKLRNNLAAGDTIFTVRGTVDQITLRNLTINGNSGTKILRCENSGSDTVNTIVLDNVIINSLPATAYDFDGCNDVQILGGEINGSSSVSSNVISIQNDVNGISISGLTMKNINGTALKIYDASNVSIDFDLTTLNTGKVADLDNIRSFSLIDIFATDVENGVVMNYVTGTNNDDIVNLNLTGNRSGNGVGLKLDQYATKLEFPDLYVTNFGGNGVELRDSSNENTFDDAEVLDNVGYGFYLTDVASGTVIKNSLIQRNGDCGIFLDSSEDNIIYDNELPSNGDACPIGVSSKSSVESIASSDVTIIPTFDDEILVDMARTSVRGGDATYLELHYLTSNYSGSGSSGDTEVSSGATVSRRAKTSKSLLGVNAVRLPLATSLSLNGQVKTGVKKPASDSTRGSNRKEVEGEVGIGGDTSRIQPTFEVAALPDSRTDISSAESFFAVVTDANHVVLGVWSGSANSNGERCYTDPNSSNTYRIWDEDENMDYDSDGLKDREEDPDGDCRVDADEGESNPDLYDTDGDGLNDFIEIKTLKTNPNLTDHDGDGLWDGQEDADHDGAIEKENGETDPLKSDTDGDGYSDAEEAALGLDPNDTDSDDDGSNDKADSCPMIHPDEGICYYDTCTPGVALAIEQDTDEDGIRDDSEDSNLNCQRDSNETDAGNPDTDGDGIKDGVEDYNQNGVYEASLKESNPLATDTDGDEITDGKEDENGDGYVDIAAGETSPVVTDTDEDTISDGDEDWDRDGKVDSGETNPSVSDTDGDGSDDVADICPWSIKPNCVVRFCEVSGFDSYDADLDNLPDADEDSNGDCTHTPSSKESDPLDNDTDDDGLTDDLEACYETNPNVADTDGDGRSDYQEVENSGEICQPMYNLGSSNPLRAEFGNCALMGGIDATSSMGSTIIGMSLIGMLGLLMTARLMKNATRN